MVPGPASEDEPLEDQNAMAVGDISYLHKNKENPFVLAIPLIASANSRHQQVVASCRSSLRVLQRVALSASSSFFALGKILAEHESDGWRFISGTSGIG